VLSRHPQPRVRMKKAHEHSHHRYAETFRHSPRDGFNGLFRALPGVPGLIATVACGITRKLDTSVGVSGPHDFAVRIVSLASRFNASTASCTQRPWRSRVRPSWWDRTARLSASDLPDGTRRIFFARGLDTNSQSPPVGQIRCRHSEPGKKSRVVQSAHFLSVAGR
jgi:hypothetical protein